MRLYKSIEEPAASSEDFLLSVVVSLSVRETLHFTQLGMTPEVSLVPSLCQCNFFLVFGYDCVACLGSSSLVFCTFCFYVHNS
jgi:hypothetical protein